MKTLQDFQLRQHEIYLRAFTKLFRQVDLDNDGVLEEHEFLSLISDHVAPAVGVGFTREETAYFLQVLDPFNTQRITFSEVVQLFSAHQVSGDIPILEKLNQ